MDLFDYMRENQKDDDSPLAKRMRPENLDEVIGQEHIIGKNKLLYRAIKADKLGSLIFYGPPGTGKTTLAMVIAHTTKADFKQINATTSGKKDMEQIIEEAKNTKAMYGRRTILFIDEIHMIVGAGAVSHGEKQDLSNALKPILAGDDAIVIGATTDEEYAQTFGMEGALRRRFKTITVREPRTTEVYDMLKESIRQLEEFHGVRISKKMVEMIIFYSSCFNYNTSNPDRTKDLIDVSMVCLLYTSPSPRDA